MITNFSDYIGESSKEENDLEFIATKAISSLIQDLCEDHYLNLSSFTRPLVNRIELSFEYGEYQITPTKSNTNDELIEGDYVFHVNVSLKPTFDPDQIRLLASDDIDVLTDLGLVNFNTLIENCRIYGTLDIVRNVWPTEETPDPIEYPGELTMDMQDISEMNNGTGAHTLSDVAIFIIRKGIEEFVNQTYFKVPAVVRPA